MSEVIDWGAAMEQCGDDREFLLELLNDLQEEIVAQSTKINTALTRMVSVISRAR